MKRHGRSRKRRGPARRRRSLLSRALGLGRGSNSRLSHYQVAVPVLNREVDRSLIPPRLSSALLLIAAGWLVYWFSSADTFYIQSLRVEGSQRLTGAELMTISGLEGVNVFWVDVQAVEQGIEALPEVKSARLRCNLPADCVVHLVERSAGLIWRQGDAEVWVSSDGTVLEAQGVLPNAIVLDAVGSTAQKPGDRLDPMLVAAVAELERLQPEVRVYEYSDEYGLSFRNAYGWLIRLGGGKDIEAKLDLLHTLTHYLPSQGIAPSFVDLRYPEAPYYGE